MRLVELRGSRSQQELQNAKYFPIEGSEPKSNDMHLDNCMVFIQLLCQAFMSSYETIRSLRSRVLYA